MIIDSSVDEVARLEAEPKGMRETDVRDFLSARLRDADRADEKSPTLFFLLDQFQAGSFNHVERVDRVELFYMFLHVLHG